MTSLRALTGTLASQPTRLEPCVVRVEPDRVWLKERIARRTRVLVGPAWRDEVRALLDVHGEALRGFQSMQAIGYPLILDAVLGMRPWNEEDLANDIATLTWQYARRQFTWNRKETAQATWDPAGGDVRPVFSAVLTFLKRIGASDLGEEET